MARRWTAWPWSDGSTYICSSSAVWISFILVWLLEMTPRSLTSYSFRLRSLCSSTCECLVGARCHLPRAARDLLQDSRGSFPQTAHLLHGGLQDGR